MQIRGSWAAMAVVCLTVSLTARAQHARTRGHDRGHALEVEIENEARDPVPVTLEGTTQVAGTVSIGNTPNVAITNSPTVTVGNSAASPVLIRDVGLASQQPMQIDIGSFNGTGIASATFTVGAERLRRHEAIKRRLVHG